MFYFFSNSNKIDLTILANLKFKEEDTLFIFNKKNDTIIKLILNHIDIKYDFKIKVIWVQRDTLCEPLYRGSTSSYITNNRFDTFYLIGGASLSKDRSKSVFSYNDKIIECMKEDVKIYSNKLLKSDNKRKIFHIIFKDMIEPYGSGYELFDIKNYEPYTGFLTLIYFDKLYPNEKKTMIGFNCYQDRNKKANRLVPGHRDLLDYNLLKSYCINRKINLRYSKLINGKLIDDNFKNYKPLFTLNELIDIENPDSKLINKCKNYDKRVNLYINKSN